MDIKEEPGSAGTETGSSSFAEPDRAENNYGHLVGQADAEQGADGCQRHDADDASPHPGADATPGQDQDDTYDIVAEQSLIGSCLYAPSVIAIVADICSPEDFYDPLHQRIYAMVLKIHDAGGTVSPDSLRAVLADDPGLAVVAGDYLEAMVDLKSADPCAAAKRVVDLAGVRDPSRASADETIIPPSFDILPTFSAAEFDGQPVPPRKELVEGLIPAGKVTILNGDGGTGKTLLAMMLAVAMQLHTNWLGKLVNKNGPVLFISAEEDRDELHRRLNAVLAEVGQPFRELQHLHLSSLVGHDALLAVRNERGTLDPTDLYTALRTRVAALKPELVTLDALADVFGGNEIDRTHARQFVSMLQRMCLEDETTVLLLAHPSLSGMATGSGTSGSTAWNNSVRSRLYLERIKDKNGSEDDPDRRVLKSMKANYGPTGQQIPVRWEKGVFKVIKDGDEQYSYAVRMRDAKAERVFLDMLAAYNADGRDVGAMPGANYAPKMFADDKRSEGIGKTALHNAMDRLFEQKRIAIDETGPPSRRKRRIVIVPAYG